MKPGITETPAFNAIMKTVQAGGQLGEDGRGAALWQGVLTNTWEEKGETGMFRQVTESFVTPLK